MLEVKIDARGALSFFNQLQTDQIPFAISKGLNLLGKDAQEAEQAALGKHFHLRRVQWNLRGIKISKFSSKTDHRLIIEVAENTNYLDKFEEGGEKVPHMGRKKLAIPNPQVFKSGSVPKGSPFKPTALKLHRVGATYRGEQRTFIAPFKGSDHSGIFQRINPKLVTSGKKGLKGLTLDNFAGGMGPNTRKQKITVHRTAGIRLLYTLTSRVPIKAQLVFVDTIRATVLSQYRERMNQAMADAIRTRR